MDWRFFCLDCCKWQPPLSSLKAASFKLFKRLMTVIELSNRTKWFHSAFTCKSIRENPHLSLYWSKFGQLKNPLFTNQSSANSNPQCFLSRNPPWWNRRSQLERALIVLLFVASSFAIAFLTTTFYFGLVLKGKDYRMHHMNHDDDSTLTVSVLIQYRSSPKSDERWAKQYHDDLSGSNESGSNSMTSNNNEIDKIN